MAKNIITVLIAGELKGVREAAAEAKHALSEVETKSQSTGKKLAKYGAAAAAGIAGVALAAGAYAVKVGSELQESTDNLDNALENTHQSMKSFGGGLDALLKRNEKWGKTNADVYDSLQVLVRAGVPAKKAMEDEATAANLAAARHISLAAATSIVAKVETGHVSLLGRLGIQTKDATGKTISQAQAMQMLGEKYGGAADAAGTTFQGKIAASKAQLEDTAAKIGVKLIPILLKLAQFVVGYVIPAIAAIASWISNKLIPALVNFSVRVLELYNKYVKPSIDGIVKYFKGLYLQVTGIFDLFNDLFHGRWGKIWGDLKQIATGIIDQLVGAFKALPARLLAALGALASVITAPFRAVFNKIAGYWNNTVGSLSFKTPKWIPGIGGKGFSMPKIPTLHRGGMFNSGVGEGLAWLQDGERVLSRAETAEFGRSGGGNLTQNFPAGIDPSRAAAAARTHSRRNGVTGKAA